MKFAAVLLLCSFSCSLQAQTIPAERTVNWSLAGLEADCFADWPVLNIISAGGHADGSTSNDAVLAEVLDGLTEPTIIYFPSGDYLFEDQIALPSGVVLRGNGADHTTLIFNLAAEKDLIAAKGSAGAVTVSIIGAPAKGNSVVKVSDPSSFSPGNFIIVNDDDTELVNNTWALGTTGQIVRIISIAGNNLTLNEPLRRTYPADRSPYVRSMNMVTDVGIEALGISNLSPMSSQRSNIFFRYVWNGYVSCVESYKTNYAHVELEHAAHCAVTGSYFQDAWAYDDGGKGYGVLAHYAAGANLISGNIFKHLRHSMLVQAGANGNVFSYNYSEDPFWTGTVLPSDAAGDLVLHGNYPYANLFEGNILQNLVVDDSHGLNGPYNTFFRNRADNYGIVMSNASVGNDMHFIGNEVTNTGFLKGLYSIYGSGHIEFGNNIKGTVTPAGTSPLPEQTLYLGSVPSFYLTTGNWPPIGIPNAISSEDIESHYRFVSGDLTLCADCGPSCSYPEDLNAGPVLINKASLSWTTVTDASRYEVQYKPSGAGPWNKVKPLENNVLLTGLMPGTNYVWKVRSRCPDGWTAFSPNTTFTTLSMRAGEGPKADIFPNPATDALSIHLHADGGVIQIMLTDLHGRRAYTETVTHEGGQWIHSIRPLPAPGIYLLQVYLKDEVITEKVVIE